jgi:hypothetical protein
MSTENPTVKLGSLVKAITTVATCSENESVNLEALMTLGQVLSPSPRFGRRGPVPSGREPYSLMRITDDDYESEGLTD